MEFRRLSDKERGGTVTMNKNWKPIHTSIVLEYAAGKSIDYLADKYGYAHSSLANILRTRRAKEMMAGIERKVLSDGVDALPDAVKRAKILAFQRVQTFLQDDSLAEKSPFAFFDRSVKALETLDKLEKPIIEHHASVNQQNVQLNIFGNPEKLNELTEGLNRALEVSQMYASLPAETVDGSSAEFSRIEGSREASINSRER
jgi:hypothetical protein